MILCIPLIANGGLAIVLWWNAKAVENARYWLPLGILGLFGISPLAILLSIEYPWHRNLLRRWKRRKLRVVSRR